MINTHAHQRAWLVGIIQACMILAAGILFPPALGLLLLVRGSYRRRVAKLQRGYLHPLVTVGISCRRGVM